MGKNLPRSDAGGRQAPEKDIEEGATWLFVGCCALVSFGTDLANPAGWAFIGDVGGRATAAAGGWANMWGNLGASAGALLFPWLRALALIYDVPPPANAQERRALWERAGVADDELSNIVLAAGIAPAGDDVASQILRTCAGCGGWIGTRRDRIAHSGRGNRRQSL